VPVKVLRVGRVGAGLITVQDEGRRHRGHQGVARSGAWDLAAFALANRLAGNAPDMAVLECTAAELELTAAAGVVVAVTGAEVEVSVDGRGAGTDTAVAVPAGSTLRLGAPSRGLRAYVAVRGGIAVEPVLGSRSFDTLGRIGPPPLRPGDELPVGADPGPGSRPWFERVPVVRPSGDTLDVAVTPGPRLDWLTPGAAGLLLATRWVVSPAGDRTGIRLEGPALDRIGGEIPSEAMVPGAVQVPAGGKPIVLGPDCGTTGGYPVVAVVTRSDLDRLAQLRPGDGVRFRTRRPGR
jgi:biotin-dependent carboxylase-like uncharacterized protein